MPNNIKNNEANLSTSDIESKETKEKIQNIKQETNGPKGLEPTRFGDWERNGRCIDF